MMEVRFRNVDAVLNKSVSDQGVIVGLKKWAGRTVKIVVLNHTEELNGDEDH